MWGYYIKCCGRNHWMWSLSDQQSSEHSSVDQEIKKCFKVGLGDQGPNLAIKNFDRRHRWKPGTYCIQLSFEGEIKGRNLILPIPRPSFKIFIKGSNSETYQIKGGIGMAWHAGPNIIRVCTSHTLLHVTTPPFIRS